MSIVNCRQSANTSNRSSRVAFALLLVCLAGAHAAAQVACPAPWATAQNVYGFVILEGHGSGSSGSTHETANQSAVTAGKLIGFGQCAWQAIPNVGLGQMKSQGNVSDVVTDPNNPSNNATWSAFGTGDILWDSMLLEIIPSAGQYVVGAFGAIPGTLKTDQGTIKEDIIWGATTTGGGVSEPNQPFPATPTPFLFGSANYQATPLDNAQGGEIANSNWTATWLFTPMPDGNCDKCKRGDPRGSAISVRSQSLSEDINLVGTAFSLHYESERAAGRAGADLFAVRDALSLGGWTLDAHHAFEPLLMAYCAGGSCTPYALVPKALFLGDGTVRTSAEVQAPVVVGSNFELTSEDGTEIYVFDSASGKHTQTLLPMTGAVLYNFGYDANGLLITITDGSGNVTTIQRDTNGHPIGIVSPYGQTTALSVDANGYLSQVTDPMGNSIKLTTSSLGLLSSFKDANGSLYSFQYDANGFLTRDSDPVGGVINLALTNNSSGYSVAETTAQGRLSTDKVAFSNTSSSTTRQYTNTWPEGIQATESDTQQSGQLAESVSMPNGSSYSTTLGPDPRWGIQVPVITSESLTRGGLIMNIANSRTASLANPADPFSLITQTDTENINGRIFKSVFTASSKTYLDTTPAGRKMTTIFDSLERIASTQPAGLALTSFTYDSRGNLVSLSEGNRDTTLAYDASGYLASVTNSLNLTRSFTHDADGRLTTMTIEDGRVINYSYDADGNLISITPPGAPVHTLAYSAVNLPTSYSPPVVSGGGVTTYSYSPDREMTKLTRPDGQIVNYSYDNAGRLISVSSPATAFNFAYDSATGNLSSASVSGGEAIAYSYSGSLPVGQAWSGAIAGSVGRAFNNNFWVTSQTINGGNAIAFSFDNDGLVKKAGTLTVKHNAVTGLYTGAALGKASDTIAYNTFGEPTAHTAKFGTAVLYKANYTRDNAGGIISLKDTVGGTVTTYTYEYDQSGRLTEVDSGIGKTNQTLANYTYDSNSNRLSVTTSAGTTNATYDAQDRLITYGSNSYTYNANGELATRTGGSQVTTYQYDVLGNLTSVVLPGGSQVTYVIDAENNRVGKKVNGAVVAGFLYDGNNLVAQLDAGNNIVSQFVYAGNSTSPDYLVTGGITYRIFSDHRGSPRLVVDSATGAIAQRIDYDEFGNVVNDTNPGFQPFGFAGGLYDQDTKLLRFGARDYDPGTGRWTAKDPVLFSGGDTNLYGYGWNNPINIIDPSGLEGEDCPCPKQRNPLVNFLGGAVDNIARGMNPFLGVAPYVAAYVAGTSTFHAGGPAMTQSARDQTGTSHWVDTDSHMYTAGEVVSDLAGGLLSATRKVAVKEAASRLAKSGEDLAIERLGQRLKNIKNPKCKLVKQPKGTTYNGGGGPRRR